MGGPSYSEDTLTRILILGDSVTAGYGVPIEKAFPNLIGQHLLAKRKPVKVINGGISGSTSASGLGRLKWQLKNKPQILVLALGANDGLRGVPIESTKGHLSSIIRLAKKNKIKVLLAGMLVPPNYGKSYFKQFQNMFTQLAKDENVPLIPFLLKDVAGQKDKNISDGIHPNEKGHEIISRTVLSHLEPLL